MLRNSRPTVYISPGAFLGSTDDVDIVEVSQHGGREEEIDKGENSPDTLHASENAEKRGKYTEEKESQRADSTSKFGDSYTTQYKY
jgi:hypothetical protein